MKFATRLSALALFLGLAATASLGFSPGTAHEHGAAPCVSDPDPADCPFCGGNPVVHVRRLNELQRVQMAILAALAR